MKLYRKLEAFFLFCISALWKIFVKMHENKNIKKKKKLYSKVILTNEQKKQIDDFYLENYGKKISYKWHRLYQSYTGRFDYRYIPDYIYTALIEPKYNKRTNVLPFENKTMLSRFVSGLNSEVRIPKTYVHCIDGVYFDAENNIISKEQAIRLVNDLSKDLPDMFVKKTVDTNSGRGVRLVRLIDGVDVILNEKLEDVLSKMGKNFVVQEKIIPHKAFSVLYSDSINTLRVISYITQNGYKVAPIIMRIGKSGYVDNAHAGGMFIGVTNDGKLLKEAYTEYQERYTEHPVTGCKFLDYHIPCVPQIIDAAVEMHKNYPTLKFISWDFTVDKNENIVLIEANLHSQAVWVSQAAHGVAMFGDDTAELLRELR